ncbi:MAG: 3-phosphoshikimate 1-carboxyvinyltransferase [Actinobacteria bacterium]|nr:3-phosphoshikimate 1-carboxyvinyltransferase [Actinomycetota bacterium]
MVTATFTPPDERFHGSHDVPGDKSLSHRALILAAMAEGTSRVRGVSTGHDVRSMLGALDALGVAFEGDHVVSPGVRGWAAPAGPLDLRNSGTALRVLTGALAAHPSRVSLTGDASLRARPMRRLVAPLAALGAPVELTDGCCAPVTTGGADLRGAHVTLAIASAQVRTAVAVAALQAEGPSSIDSPGGFRDHTERWLAALGLGRWAGRTRFEILPGLVPPTDYPVPRDPSSAAFLWAAAALSPGSSVRTPGVSLNPGRIGFLDVLEQMGATVERRVTSMVLGDPVGDVTVAGASLRGAHVGGDLAVRTIDELPLVAVCAGVARGETRITGAAELRAKESDRIAAVVTLLRDLGADADPTADGFIVAGGARYRAARTSSGGDHRIAMAAAVAATAAGGPVTVDGFDAADVSWPGFDRALEAAWSSR